MEIKINKRLIIPELKSLSGVEIMDDKIFVTGDNLPDAFQINEKGKILKKYNLIPKTEFEGGLMPKHIKPDFEAMCKVKFESGYFLFVFGSGSKSPQRDVLFVIDPEGIIPAKKYSLFEFYSVIRIKCNITADDLNIEAAVFYNGDVMLFNRGQNLIIQFAADDLFQHLENRKYIPEFTFFNIDLPVLKYIPAGFSGADIVENKIIFTASVENTFNWIDDGEVLGSYIGFINFKNLKNGYKPPCKLLKEKDAVLKLKIESVAIQSVTMEKMSLILVSDSDGSDSEIIFCDLMNG
jgi:hypothetical protein